MSIRNFVDKNNHLSAKMQQKTENCQILQWFSHYYITFFTLTLQIDLESNYSNLKPMNKILLSLMACSTLVVNMQAQLPSDNTPN